MGFMNEFRILSVDHQPAGCHLIQIKIFLNLIGQQEYVTSQHLFDCLLIF